MSFCDTWDPDHLLVCPLDDTHRITAKRFQRHIVKCRKNHPEKDTATCPYNATHILIRSELSKHVANCPDRRAIDPDIIQARCEETGEIERLMGNVSLPDRNWKSPNTSEDWDKEAEHHEYQKCSKVVGNSKMEGNSFADFRPRRPNFEHKMSSDVTYYAGNNRSHDPSNQSSLRESSLDADDASFSGNNTTNNSSYVRMAGRGVRRAAKSRPQNVRQYNPPGKQFSNTRQCIGRGTKFENSLS